MTQLGRVAVYLLGPVCLSALLHACFLAFLFFGLHSCLTASFSFPILACTVDSVLRHLYLHFCVHDVYVLVCL